MESFIKKVFEGNVDEEVHGQFTRFGKGDYKKRFQISYNKVKKIKVKASFEFANDFVKFIKELKDVEFSGSILTKEKVENKTGKKKGNGFVYEIVESNIEEFVDASWYLLDVKDEEIILKIKKKLPKPGKSENKIDNKFCIMELDFKYWDKFKETFFWDIPDSKKANITHEIVITDIEIPKDEPDPIKMREKAIRKGKIIRHIDLNGEEEKKEVKLEV